MRIETPRLVIRALLSDDEGPLHEVYSDPEVMRYLEPPFTRQQTHEFVEKKPVFALALRESGQVIGHVVWHLCDESSYELGWVIGRAYWGKGYACEVTQALMAQALGRQCNIVIQCHPEQAVTRHIAEKFGFYDLGLENGLQTYRFLYKVTEGGLSREQRDALICSLLGKTVEVEIDRPIGYVHVTNGLTLRYQVNYGFLPGVMAGDGDEQDAYVLGVDEPLTHFTGTVIGAIRRADDNEDKLVVAPEGLRFHQAQIAEATWFVEQYFSTTIDTLYRKACGVIAYRRREGRVEYLMLLQRRTKAWSFPKGHMEAGETEEQTARRELREETGLSARLDPNFRAEMWYNVNELTRKQLILFLGEVREEPTVEEPQIEAFRWFTQEEIAPLLLPDARELLARAQQYITEGQTPP